MRYNLAVDTTLENAFLAASLGSEHASKLCRTGADIL